MSFVCNQVRLVNGINPLEGRVEVFSNGTWGTICDDFWGLDDAMVICRELGFSGAVQALSRAAFGRGSGPILLDDVFCTGTEETVFDCQHRGIGNHNCEHYDDAGVRCGKQ